MLKKVHKYGFFIKIFANCAIFEWNDVVVVVVGLW